MKCFSAIAMILVLILLTACYGEYSSRKLVNDASLTQGSPGGDQPSSSQSTDAQNGGGSSRSISIDAVLAELKDASPPAHVDAVIFNDLKAALEREFKRLYAPDGTYIGTARQPGAVNFADGSQAWCLQGTIGTDGTVTIFWRGRLVGDYDLNGEVGIPDITPIAENYLAIVELDSEGLPVVGGDNEYLAQVDGDGSGDIGISDITPIAQNYLASISGYRLYYGISTDGTNITWQPTYIANPDDPGLPVTLPFNTARGAAQVQMFEASFPSPDLTAPAELFIKVAPFDGESEGAEAVIPVPEGPHMTLKCELCHQVTDLQFKGEVSACRMCHVKPPDNTAKNWTDSPGSHSTCMTCHQSHGFAISPVESVCGTCHSLASTRVASSKMTSCKQCHVSVHVPEVPADNTICLGCHANPPENLTADWATAPGQHSLCFQCHADHNFKVDLPSSVCSNCHGGHGVPVGHESFACLQCHQVPHLPTIDPDIVCNICH